MANVTLTAALRSNLLSLQGTQKLLDSTQLRLATGKKVNSALDNANAFFASQSLNFRANDLSNLLDGMGQAIQVLKAADQGITSLTTLVEQAQSIVQGARDTVSSSGMARSGNITASIAANLTSGGFANNDTIFLEGHTTGTTDAAVSGTVTITTGMTLAQLASAINAISGFSAQIVDASSAGAATSKRLEIRATSGRDLEITGANFIADFNNGGGTGTGGTSPASGTPVTATNNSPDQITAENQYNAIRTQINQLITDTGYRGTNLLNGDTLITKFNETGTSSQSVVGVSNTATGLGISAASFATSTTMDTAINEVKSALNTLRAQAKTFGNNLSVVQTRQDFTQNLVNTLKEGADKLTLADKNEEGANLLSLQTSQQLGITALSLASQASQSVLQLFQ
jgi:flagellin